MSLPASTCATSCVTSKGRSSPLRLIEVLSLVITALYFFTKAKIDWMRMGAHNVTGADLDCTCLYRFPKIEGRLSARILILPKGRAGDRELAPPARVVAFGSGYPHPAGRCAHEGDMRVLVESDSS